MSGPRPTHLFRRSAVYWVRFRLPRDVAVALECTEIRRSLGVKDLADAKKRCLAAALWFQSLSHTVHSVEIAQGLNGYRVELVFRGRNAFGGMVMNTAAVTTDDTGLHVLSVE